MTDNTACSHSEVCHPVPGASDVELDLAGRELPATSCDRGSTPRKVRPQSGSVGVRPAGIGHGRRSRRRSTDSSLLIVWLGCPAAMLSLFMARKYGSDWLGWLR